jgi:NADPH:quinone reductase-like Zn-dependent oxidoreductase
VSLTGAKQVRMKAAIVETPGVFCVREVEAPTVGAYDALCQMLFGATCTGTDTHLIDGCFPWPVTYPTILGHESIGRIIEVGPKVRHLKVGDLVTRVGTPAPPNSGIDVNWGGFAELGIAKDFRAMQEDGLPAEEWQVFRVNQTLPPDTNPAAATMMITWRETWSFISRMGVGPGAKVLVLGSGGVGLAFVAHAKNLGAAEVAVVGQVAREQQTRAAGATKYFDYKSEHLAEQLSAAYPDGFDFVIDSVGKAGQLSRILPAVRSGGLLTTYGLDDHGSLSIDLSQARGTFTYYFGGYDEAEAHDEVVAMLQDGRLDARWWLDLDHPFSLDNISDAYQAVRERRQIKALIRLSAS